MTTTHKLSRPVYEIVREYFPDAGDEEADGILWSHTGWPCFFAGDPETAMRKQLAAYADAVRRGVRLCDFCTNETAADSLMCANCQTGLERAREQMAERDAPPAGS